MGETRSGCSLSHCQCAFKLRGRGRKRTVEPGGKDVVGVDGRVEGLQSKRFFLPLPLLRQRRAEGAQGGGETCEDALDDLEIRLVPRLDVLELLRGGSGYQARQTGPPLPVLPLGAVAVNVTRGHDPGEWVPWAEGVRQDGEVSRPFGRVPTLRVTGEREVEREQLGGVQLREARVGSAQALGSVDGAAGAGEEVGGDGGGREGERVQQGRRRDGEESGAWLMWSAAGGEERTAGASYVDLGSREESSTGTWSPLSWADGS